MKYEVKSFVDGKAESKYVTIKKKKSFMGIKWGETVEYFFDCVGNEKMVQQIVEVETGRRLPEDEKNTMIRIVRAYIHRVTKEDLVKEKLKKL